MEYVATITDFDFHPMVELVPSILNISLDVPKLGHPVYLEDKGSIEYLSAKYGFTIEKGPVWDFNIVGRKCLVAKTEQGYRFIKFL